MDDNTKLLLIYLALGLTIILEIFSYAGKWRIFKKAGEKGWKAIIPICNTITEYSIFWTKEVGFVFILLSAALISYPNVKYKFTDIPQYILYAAFFFFILLDYVKNMRLAKHFGKGTLYAIGLTIIPELFNIVLGFGKAEFRIPDIKEEDFFCIGYDREKAKAFCEKHFSEKHFSKKEKPAKPEEDIKAEENPEGKQNEEKTEKS